MAGPFRPLPGIPAGRAPSAAFAPAAAAGAVMLPVGALPIRRS